MKIAYDLKLKRPGCVLIAAGMGADMNLASELPTEDWLLSPTPDMRVFEISAAQFETLRKYHWDKRKKTKK